MNRQVEHIKEILNKSGTEYELIPLPEDLPLDVPSHVMFHKITFKEAVPTIIYKTEKGLVAVQRRADTKFNLQRLKEFLGVKSLEFANTEDLEKIGTGVGIVPLVGLAIPYVVDQKVLEQNQIYGGSNNRLFALKLSAKGLIDINKAKVGDFTQAAEVGKKRVYSGIRATGKLHLGNYLGAVKGMLALQDTYDCTFSVVDLHVMTTPYDTKTLKDSIRSVVLDYLAAGLDPDKCRIEIQSQIPQHTELAYLLSTIYPLAPLQDLPTFKEKVAQYPKHVTTALLYYPILMAADVLLYKGELVPVGIDQEPHLEVMRECARKFNHLYGETFPEPYRFKTAGEYVPSLLGKGKMSKTVEGSFINLIDSLDQIQKKIAGVPTDSGTTGGRLPNEGGIANLFTLIKLFNQDDMYKKYEHDYNEGKIRYGDLKKELSEIIFQELQPIQKKRTYFAEHPKIVDAILEKSKDACLSIASETVQEVKEKMGLPL